MTIFETPIIRHFLKLFGWLYLKLAGWTLEWSVPKEVKKYIIIVYPHTSNWDFPAGMAATFSAGKSLRWMGKDSLFRFPFRHLMKWLGGIAIDRSQSNDLVAWTIEQFNSRENLIITIPPEGTRGYRDYWKSGFYHIATGANIPIAFGYIDYKTHKIGVGGVYQLTGDKEKDLEKIRDFYAGKEGLHTELAGDIRFRS